MRRALGWGIVVGLTAVAAVATAAPQRPGADVVMLSGPSTFPQDGCGQADPDWEALGEGRVATYGAERGQEFDVSVVVNPVDPTNVVAAWIQDSGLGIVVASSFDGGRTFARTIVPRLTVCNGGSAQHVLHARLAAAPDGTLYVAGETLDGYWPDLRSGVNTLPVSVSRDGGVSWSNPVFVPTPPALNGLDTIAAGPLGIAVAWHTPEPVAATYVSTSGDGGLTWQRSAVPGGPPDALPSQRIVAAPDGSYHLLTVESTLREFLANEGAAAVIGDQRAVLVSRTSVDAGATWSEPSVVARGVPGQWVGAALAPDRRLGVTWVGPDAPNCPAPLMSQTSADGRTWSLPVILTCGVAGGWPSLAARPDGGFAVASTTAATAQDQHVQVLHVSSDDGATWTSTQLAGPFAMPDWFGLYQETAASADAVYSVFLRANRAEGERSDVLLSAVRDAAHPSCTARSATPPAPCTAPTGSHRASTRG